MTKKSDLLGGSAAFDTFVTSPPVSDRGIAIAAMTGQAVPPPAPATPKASVDRIAHNPYNPRLSLRAIQNMADSMEQVEQGVITPITVVTRAAFLAVHPEAETDLGEAALYVAIDGNRRLAGARMAGLDDLPIHIDDELARDRDELLKAALIADAQHEDLDHLDQARALAQLVDVHGSQRNVARVLGKSQGWVSQRLSLLNLSEHLRQQLAAGELTVELARKIAKFPIDDQEDALAAELAPRPPEPVASRIGATRREETPVEGTTGETASPDLTSGHYQHLATREATTPAPPDKPKGDYGVITPEGRAGDTAGPHRQPGTQTGKPSTTNPSAGKAGPQAGSGEALGDYAVITQPASDWPGWLATTAIPDVATTLINTLDRARLYDLVHALADHLRTTEE